MPFKFFKQKLKIVNVDIGIKHNFVPICKDHYFVLGQHKPSLIKNYLSYCDWVSRFLISWFKRYLVCVEVKTFTITVAKKLAIFFYRLGELKSESNANATFYRWKMPNSCSSKNWIGGVKICFHSPSRYSSLTSIYAYSSPEPFLGSTFPCSFATRVVFPDSLSPVKHKINNKILLVFSMNLYTKMMGWLWLT